MIAAPRVRLRMASLPPITTGVRLAWELRRPAATLGPAHLGRDHPRAPPASSSATVSTATTRNARNRAVGRRPRAAAARSAYQPSGRTVTATPRAATPQPAGGPGGPSTTVTTAATSSAPATAVEARRPIRCGRPRTPVAASSARSGRALAKWAPAPSSAAAPSSQAGGVAGTASTANAARAANDRPYGTTDSGVRLSGQLYASALARPTVATAPAAPPTRWASTTVDTAATPAATATVPRVTSPAATGLSRPPAAASRAASIAAFAHPTASWLDATVAVTRAAVPTPLPTASASSPEAAVTAPAGSGWQARSRAVTTVAVNTRVGPTATVDVRHAA